MIQAEGLRYGTIIADIALTVAPGELVVLLGPNGAGKTTLLRLLLGLTVPDAGNADIDGVAAATLKPADRARRISYLPQTRPVAWPARVRDIVALGRFAYGVSGRLRAEDAAAVDRAIVACDLEALADRAADTLSGGESARMHLARALAAEAPIIVADEPVASLDPRHQHRVLGLLADFVAAGGGALVVLHDLDLAARYADRLLWMSGGRIVVDGSVAATMTDETIASLYGVAARVTPDGVIVTGPL
ncbi:ABC transporter ATP-binding protein [uncultured Sphingomonas sp.]|uniref:ABC transporter ATP-binding protein n=1 Tax=uncultured Sphingomonas sp. TaxID=158754 RepID=UPI0025EB9DCD|nr:ABC transporter ATP-binding protein [uncultured Sphingomonas sp.]